MEILRVEDLSHRFPDGTEAIQGISFSLHQGELAVMAGANGSGKTVLMRHLNGLLKPTEGAVLYRGRPIHSHLKYVRSQVGLVFQNADHQLIGQTVREEIAFGPENLGWPRSRIEPRVEAVLSRFSLAHLSDRSPLSLSGGEKKRVTIAGIIAMEPELLILDEPFVGLDWPSVREVLQTLLLLHEEGTTILIITHDLGKCIDHSSRLMILHEGRLQADGPPEELIPQLAGWEIRPPAEGSWLEGAGWGGDRH